MQIIEAARLFDALSAWGQHEWGPGRPPPGEEPDLTYCQHALSRRSPMIARLIEANPRATYRARLDPADIPRMSTYNSIQLTRFAHERAKEDSERGRYVRDLVAAPEPVTGPLLCVIRNDALHDPTATIIAWDGNHRLSAWCLHSESGRTYPVESFVAATETAIATF